MHVVFRESHGLEETETPFDLGQDPADLVVLSFSDSDLGAFQAGWERSRVGDVAPRHPGVGGRFATRSRGHKKAVKKTVCKPTKNKITYKPTFFQVAITAME